MAAPTPPPPVPTRKRSAAAPNPVKQNITLRPLLPADSSAPIVYTHSDPAAAEGHGQQVTSQTIFSGHHDQPLGPPIPPQYYLGDTEYDDVITEPPDNTNGASVYDTTDKDVDNFKSVAGQRQLQSVQLGFSARSKYFNCKLIITIICCVTCVLCLWPFSCLCLFCASKFNDRATERYLEKDYVSFDTCRLVTVICIILAVCFAFVCPLIISLSVIITYNNNYFYL